MRHILDFPFVHVLSLLAPLLLASCGDPEIVTSPTTSGTGGAGAAGGGGSGGAGGEGAILVGGSGGTTTSTGSADPCDGVACGDDQTCEVVEGAGACVNNTCEEIMCGPTEVCDVGPNGGAICKDISCTSDVDCPAEQHCDGTICKDDACTPGETECLGDVVLVCAPNGSGTEEKLICGSDAYFDSLCAGDGMGAVTCTCADDWDCPANTTCEIGSCTGTGKAPTCSLPPVAFANALPTKEIQWGGVDQANKDAAGAPFPASSQVIMTPLVVNLDDDNGDGLVNERDFPEIVFTTYCGTEVTTNGIVRAIHGGGPDKGKDYFAVCGSTVWHEGDDVAMPCTCPEATGRPMGVPAAGDIDGDGVPEIVIPTEDNRLAILDSAGNIVTISAQTYDNIAAPALAIANLDQKGFAEVVVGKQAFSLEHDANGALSFVDRFTGSIVFQAVQGLGQIPCVANIAGDERPEVIAGTAVYRLPDPPAGVTKIADCAVGATDAFCTGALEVVWDGQTVNGAGTLPNAQRDGFCAIADVLGADEAAAPGPQNPLDGKAEVVLVAEGHLLILNGETGVLRRFTNLSAGLDGGAPNVDDFDGDGFPEIGTALGTAYLMLDLQDTSAACPAWPTAFNDAQMGLQGNLPRDPGGACAMDSECAAGAVCNGTLGQCTCLHNGWRRLTEDDSSRVTSSSVFDFNGDGAAEVVYNDECHFRVYDGRTSEVLFKQASPSRTRIENPVIADVDNDGNAEIVFPSNNDVSSCSTGANFPNGINVWGDSSDSWVSARRIWNQHAYHVTNVTENARIPAQEPESWKPYNGRVYNTYRSNPRSYNVAPDLAVTGVQVSSPDVACGDLSDLLTITVKIDNLGDLRVGPGVVVSFHGTWGMVTEPLYSDAMMTPLTATLQSSLEPGDSLLLNVDYNAMFNAAGSLPDEVQVVVDEADVESECKEDNNALTKVVEPSMPLADLRIDLGIATDGTCPMPEVETTVINEGAADAAGVLVRYYAGDPNAGGSPLHEEIVPGVVAANGGVVTFTATIPNFPDNLSILIHGIVDPDDSIPECNDGNNKDAAENKIECGIIN